MAVGLPALVSQSTNALWGVITLLAARVLPTEAYAAFSLGKTIEILAVIMGGGFVMQALMKFASEAAGPRRGETVNSASALSIFLTIVGAGALLAGGGLLQDFYDGIPLEGLPSVLALLVLTEGACAIPRNYLIAGQRTGTVMRGDVAGFAVRVAILAWLLLKGRLDSPHPLFLAQSASNVVCLAFLVRGGGKFFESGARVTKEALATVWKFSVFTLGSFLASYVYSSTDILMLGKLAPGEVAVYGVARSLTMFVTSLNQAANIVLLPLASRMQSTGRTRGVMARTWQGIAIVEVIQLPFIAVFAVFPRQILHLLFGGRYDEGWPVVMVLALLNLFKPLGSLFSSTASGLGKPEYSLHSVTASAILNVGLNAMLIPVLGGLGAAIATVVSVIVGGAVIYLAVRAYLTSGGESGEESGRDAPAEAGLV
ncbi:MAG TPA: oligosaccharide flippase family protein [Candidatus Fermentibacter daniensis]|nr:oligosaccharide flippase family protein [Candidatus Fermentibacter daniensis]